jgi:hypothetical protein
MYKVHHPSNSKYTECFERNYISAIGAATFNCIVSFQMPFTYIWIILLYNNSIFNTAVTQAQSMYVYIYIYIYIKSNTTLDGLYFKVYITLYA